MRFTDLETLEKHQGSGNNQWLQAEQDCREQLQEPVTWESCYTKVYIGSGCPEGFLQKIEEAAENSGKRVQMGHKNEGKWEA